MYKKILFICVVMVASLASCSEKNNNSFGELITADGAINATQLIAEMGNSPELEIKIKGKINEVCQESGCWLIMDIGNGESMRVTFKDYGFFVPKDCSGKEVIIDGKVFYQVTSVEDLQHLAGDAGKSVDEIKAITEPSEDLVFEAKGVLIL